MPTRVSPPQAQVVVARPARANKPDVYWWPVNTDQQTTCQNLGPRNSATLLIALQDPVDNINLRGTIVGGQIEVLLYDAAVSSFVSAPELIVGIWPATINPPANYTSAGMKEYEEYIWYRQLMDPQYTHVAANAANFWKGAIKLSTQRKVPQRGERIGIGILNHDASPCGAGAMLEVLCDLYWILDA